MNIIYQAFIYWSLAPIAFASAQCTNGEVRLIGTATSGLVEMCHEEQWSPVCNDDEWDDIDAGVVCRQLELPSSGAIADAYFHVNSVITHRGVFITKVMCTGNEAQLSNCNPMAGVGCSTRQATADCQNATCTRGDIRLRGKHGNDTAVSGGVDVCVEGGWRTVCRANAWLLSMDGSKNAKVACRQLGYQEEGAINQAIEQTAITSSSKSQRGYRHSRCNGRELRLIGCPNGNLGNRCSNRAFLACQLAKCDTTIRLRGGRTATEGRVEVCRDGQWGTVCDDSWDRNDASVACRQLGLSNFNAVAVPSAYFGAGSARIHLSNLQCTGSEAALTDCTLNTTHQCSHNQDASVICLTSTIIYTAAECTNGRVRITLNSNTKRVEFCRNQIWNVCNNPCEVTQLGAYFCGSGEITHFLKNGFQLYECPISGAGELFLICELTSQTPATLANSCQQELQDLELEASPSSITITWGSTANTPAEYEITCSPEESDLRHSIVVEPTTSEVTIENLPHSTTYECCVTLHIGRYSTRACSNTATLADIIPTTNELPNVTETQSSTNNNQFENDAIQGAGLWVIIALGVLVAVLVLLLVLVTGAWLYLLITRGNKKRGENTAPASTNGTTHSTQGVRCFENPNYSRHELTRLTPPHSTPHPLTPPTPPPTVTLPAPPHTLTLPTPPPTLTTPPFTTETPFDIQSEYSVIKPLERVDKNAKKITEEDYEKDQTPTYEVPIVSLESPRPAGERAPEEYSRLKR